MNVHHMGWGASSAAVAAACTVAGYESPTTRQRVGPVEAPPVDYLAERASALKGQKTGPKPKRPAGATVIAIREARKLARQCAPEPDPIVVVPEPCMSSEMTKAR